MAYLRCESCGAKALVAASRCPRCAADFNLVAAGGGRLPLVQCRTCGIMHARGRACHWCPEQGRSSWRSPMVGIAASAVLLAGAGASSWRYRAEIESAYGRVMERTTAPAIGVNTAGLAFAQVGERAAAPSVSPAISPVEPVPVPLDPIPSGPQNGAEAGIAVSAVAATLPQDTVQWVPAVARTWVNVRNEAGRDNQVVGVIRTGSRALLGGTGREGWRQVRTDSATGWVNPKHFLVDSVRTRG